MRRTGSPAARLLLPAILLAGCATPAPDTVDSVELLTGEATIEIVELEGGCWTLELAGERLSPLALPEAFRVDGLRVRVSLRPVDAATICMLGRAVEIESIEKVE